MARTWEWHVANVFIFCHIHFKQGVDRIAGRERWGGSKHERLEAILTAKTESDYLTICKRNYGNILFTTVSIDVFTDPLAQNLLIARQSGSGYCIKLFGPSEQASTEPVRRCCQQFETTFYTTITLSNSQTGRVTLLEYVRLSWKQSFGKSRCCIGTRYEHILIAFSEPRSLTGMIPVNTSQELVKEYYTSNAIRVCNSAFQLHTGES